MIGAIIPNVRSAVEAELNSVPGHVSHLCMVDWIVLEMTRISKVVTLENHAQVIYLKDKILHDLTPFRGIVNPAFLKKIRETFEICEICRITF